MTNFMQPQKINSANDGIIMDVQIIPTFQRTANGVCTPDEPKVLFTIEDDTHELPRVLAASISADAAAALANLLTQMADEIKNQQIKNTKQ